MVLNQLDNKIIAREMFINYDQETSENRPDNIYFEAEDDTRCAANQDTQDFSYRESFTNGKTFVDYEICGTYI